MKKYYFIIFIILLFLPLVSKGAVLYLEPSAGQYHQGDIFLIEIRLDSQGEIINTVKVDLSFPPEFLEVRDFSKGNSVLTLWPKEPAFSKGVISFTGGVPGGYWGKDGLLAKIVVKAISMNPVELNFLGTSKILLNDGLGTRAKLETRGAIFEIVGAGPLQDEWQKEIEKDNILPEPFKIEISQVPTIFEGKYFITFSTTDKQTGIDHYEVLEVKKRGWLSRLMQKLISKKEEWKIAESPYVLEDQKLTSDIKVKAIDKAGNFWLETLEARNQPEKELEMYITSFLVFIVLVLIIFIIKRYARHAKYEEISSS